MTEAGEELINAARETLEFVRGEADRREYGVHLPDEINPRLIRSRLNMSQWTFAETFTIELRTLQDWEQGRRVPSGAAQTLLRIIHLEPEAARRAVARGSVGAEGRDSEVLQV